MTPRPNIRFDLMLGGGVTMDFACYPVHWLGTVAEVLDAIYVAAHLPLKG